MRLLLIEDDPDLMPPLEAALKSSNYIIDTANDGESGLFLALTNHYDLIISDYNLPKMNGREMIEKLRAESCQTPVLMLTVRSEIRDKITAINAGADDYLTKPFVVGELLARARALTRRPIAIKEDKLRFRDIELDIQRFSCSKSGRKVYLTNKEFSILEILMRDPQKILSRQTIMDAAWHHDADMLSNTVETHITRLRRKLESGGEKVIENCPGRGYRLSGEK